MVDLNTNEFRKSYARILEQERFVDAAIRVADEQIPEENLRAVLDDKFGEVEKGDIEKIEEEHGNDLKWLDKNIARVENRFAYAVKVLVNADESLLDYLKEEIYKLGQEVNPEYEGKPVGYMYDVLRNLLLDGGVTEEFNKVMSEDFDEVVWTRNRPTTKKYWTYLDIDFNKYYIPLRRTFIAGVLEKTDVKFSTLDDTVFVLSRR